MHAHSGLNAASDRTRLPLNPNWTAASDSRERGRRRRLSTGRTGVAAPEGASATARVRARLGRSPEIAPARPLAGSCPDHAPVRDRRGGRHMMRGPDGPARPSHRRVRPIDGGTGSAPPTAPSSATTITAPDRLRRTDRCRSALIRDPLPASNSSAQVLSRPSVRRLRCRLPACRRKTLTETLPPTLGRRRGRRVARCDGLGFENLHTLHQSALVRLSSRMQSAIGTQVNQVRRSASGVTVVTGGPGSRRRARMLRIDANQ